MSKSSLARRRARRVGLNLPVNAWRTPLGELVARVAPHTVLGDRFTKREVRRWARRRRRGDRRRAGVSRSRKTLGPNKLAARAARSAAHKVAQAQLAQASAS